jgi:hypothetical protein
MTQLIDYLPILLGIFASFGFAGIVLFIGAVIEVTEEMDK